MMDNISRVFEDINFFRITIEASDHGWAITWPDCSVTYHPNHDTSDNNFTTAFNIAKANRGDLVEIIIDKNFMIIDTE